MSYNDIVKQWNSLIDEVRSLQEHIKECIDYEEYNSEQEKQDLKNMQKGCYELFRVLLGYFD